ncbi:MAG: CAP domain-containing protein [Planctomycetota bacterium]|nr:CAP domain-containing protein [Planctomycetota bacterium]MDA1179838.1 CAP domain-containing protein [Planctomycetota bacterium]
MNLATHANQNLRFRFYYDFTGGSAFTGTTDQDGWFVDDIQIGSAFEKIPYSIGNPSSHAQQYLEYINRARADALAEATRLANSTDPDITSAYSFFGVTGANIVSQFNAYVQNGCMSQFAQPLAFNEKLLQASELHTLDLFNNQFQGHVSSSNPPSPFQPGDTMGTRLNRVGYTFTTAAENVFSFADSVEQGHAGLDVDWGNSTNTASSCYNSSFVGQGMQNPAGHRRSIHNDSYKEVGIGVINGTNGSVGPQLVTQNFASQGASTFVTGVVYQDLNGNNFYDLGEGRGGVRVDVDGSPYYAISTASGGYTVPVSGDGAYQVTFSGGGFLNFVTGASVSGGKNVKVEYLAVPGLTGDYNGDFVVDAADFTVWRDLRLSTGVGLAADGNGDGTVNDLDYQIWVDHFGDVMGGSLAMLVPEPASGSSLLSLIAGAIVWARKRSA